MNLGLLDVTDVLSFMYKASGRMLDFLEGQNEHSIGGLFVKKNQDPNRPPCVYYRYTQDGVRRMKKVPGDQLEVCKRNIILLKERARQIKDMKANLHKIQICLRALHLSTDLGELMAPKPQSRPPAQQSAFYPKGLKHLTLRGEYVRSKSEALLANLFYFYGVPYEYEKETTLSGHTIHPDFTIPLPDGTVLYWEHLGLLDDPSYAKKWAIKHQTYMENNITEGNGLIITKDVDGTFDSIDSIMKITTYCRVFLKQDAVLPATLLNGNAQN